MERLEIVLPKDGTHTATTEAVRTEIETRRGRVVFSITLGDITQADADVIVCPSNPGFVYTGFGGVQVAIASRSGMETFREAERKAEQLAATKHGVDSPDGKLTGVPLGFVALTTAGKLERIRGIIHVNNMRMGNHPPCDSEVVRLCTASVLAEADRGNMRSVAFPALGTGILGLSMADSISGTVQGMRDHFENNPHSGIEKVTFVVYATPSIHNAIELQGILANEVFPGLFK